MTGRPVKHTNKITLPCALAAALLLTGCGGDHAAGGHDGSSHSAASPASPPAAGATFNAADVMFSTMMIPHHEQAIEMAELAGTRAGSPEVKALAQQIKGAQQPEIDLMTGWLEAWGQQAPAAGHDVNGMGHGDGMMSEDDLRRLEAARGQEFDRLFLTQMIEHHEGAVRMAEAQVSSGKNPDAVALAGRVVEDQNAEIASMRTMLER
jgi:uncharacterized protein (DUF305 family)